jgi:hypothetical protein
MAIDEARGRAVVQQWSSCRDFRNAHSWNDAMQPLYGLKARDGQTVSP